MSFFLNIFLFIIKVGQENWGSDTPMHALKKESNWIKFIQLVPHKDAIYEKAISKIRNKNRVDELLVSHAAFMEVNNNDVSSWSVFKLLLDAILSLNREFNIF